MKNKSNKPSVLVYLLILLCLTAISETVVHGGELQHRETSGQLVTGCSYDVMQGLNIEEAYVEDSAEFILGTSQADINCPSGSAMYRTSVSAIDATTVTLSGHSEAVQTTAGRWHESKANGVNTTTQWDVVAEPGDCWGYEVWLDWTRSNGSVSGKFIDSGSSYRNFYTGPDGSGVDEYVGRVYEGSYISLTPNLYTQVDSPGTSSADVSVTLRISQDPHASIAPSVRDGDTPLAVTYTNYSCGPIEQYHWDFGNGQTSSFPDPGTIYYTTEDCEDFTACLTVSGQEMSHTSNCYNIHVDNPSFVADFTYSQNDPTDPTVTFTDQSGGTHFNEKWWNFGDGTGWVLADNPTHTFPEEECTTLYDVTYYISNDGGSCEREITMTVPVEKNVIEEDIDCCGNGIVDLGEECDDRNNIDGDGCDKSCNYECEQPPINILPMDGPLSICPPENILGIPDFSNCEDERDVNEDGVNDCLIREITDDLGNKVELWCEVKRVRKINECTPLDILLNACPRDIYWYNFAYTPNGGTPKAVGACKYPWGKNKSHIVLAGCSESKIFNPTWFNVDDRDPDEDLDPRADGFIHWDTYTFNPITNITKRQHYKSINGPKGPNIIPDGDPWIKDPWPDFDALPPIVDPETLVDGLMSASSRQICDLDDDGDCDNDDYVAFQGAFNTCAGDINFNAYADFNLDGCVTDVDERMLFPDKDYDGFDNNIDNCPAVSNPAQADMDSDGVGNVCDNCREVTNPDQRDTNSGEDDNTAIGGEQHYGNVCDPDFDNNGAVGLEDFNTWRTYFRQTVPPAPEYVDMNGNGIIGLGDFIVWRQYFRSSPGPGIGD